MGTFWALIVGMLSGAVAFALPRFIPKPYETYAKILSFILFFVFLHLGRLFINHYLVEKPDIHAEFQKDETMRLLYEKEPEIYQQFVKEMQDKFDRDGIIDEQLAYQYGMQKMAPAIIKRLKHANHDVWKMHLQIINNLILRVQQKNPEDCFDAIIMGQAEKIMLYQNNQQAKEENEAFIKLLLNDPQNHQPKITREEFEHIAQELMDIESKKWAHLYQENGEFKDSEEVRKQACMVMYDRHNYILQKDDDKHYDFIRILYANPGLF